ncbi:MAG: nucleotide exchange factor GrpE, partial [Ktedonobacterales bacterium]
PQEQRMAERDETRQEQANAPSDGSATETTTASGGDSDLGAQLKAATEEAAQYKDRFLRERAEMENFKKRQERLAGDRMQRFKRDLLEKVIEVMDNLDRAMQYESSMDQESLNQGLRMVHWQLEEILKTEGLTPVATVGQPFDPHVHEAIESVASPEHPEGTVVEEVRKGYMLGGDMVRPARVKVSSGA